MKVGTLPVLMIFVGGLELSSAELFLLQYLLLSCGQILVDETKRSGQIITCSFFRDIFETGSNLHCSLKEKPGWTVGHKLVTQIKFFIILYFPFVNMKGRLCKLLAMIYYV